jgi:hypothetical protein
MADKTQSPFQTPKPVLTPAQREVLLLEAEIARDTITLALKQYRKERLDLQGRIEKIAASEVSKKAELATAEAAITELQKEG